MGAKGKRSYDWGDEGRGRPRPRRQRHDQDGGHGQIRNRERRAPGALVPRIPYRRARGPAPEAQGQAEGREIRSEAQADARAGARRGGRLPQGEGRVPGKSARPAGAEVARRERSAIVRSLAERGHRLDHLLRASGLASVFVQ